MTQKRRLIYQINTARHAMMKSLDAGCQAALDISVVQLSALMVLHERNGCLMKELATALMLDKSAVTGLAKRMQAKELITKVPCESDSRASRMVMTEQGRQKLKQGMPLLQSVNAALTEGFSEEELQTVSRFLGHVTQVFSAPLKTQASPQTTFSTNTTKEN